MLQTSKSTLGRTTPGVTDRAESGDGVLFWVNKSGFPVDEATWERMWEHVARLHPDGHGMTHKIRRSNNLPQVPIPRAPLTFGPSLTVPERLKKIQDYMKELQYNHTGTQFYEIRKNRPVSGLMEVAREMIREALPIKCLEAVVLGLFLTNGMMGVERFPIGFKTVFKGQTHRHVVLGLSHSGSYEALGMSRREDLMYKPCTFKSLAELVFDFERCYMKYWHSVKKVKVGLPVIHDQHSYECINWKGVMVSLAKADHKEAAKELDSHAKRIKSLARSWSCGPYSNMKLTSHTEAARATDHRSVHSHTHTQGGDSPARLRRSKNPRRVLSATNKQSLASPSVVRQRSSLGASLDTAAYQIRI